MTEYEIFDLANSRQGLLANMSVLYLSLVSAYLVVAFLAGEKLSRKQVTIVTVLYIAWGAGNTFATLTSAYMLQGFNNQLMALGAMDGFLAANTFEVTSFYVLFVNGGAMLASLYFMWTVRKNRASAPESA